MRYPLPLKLRIGHPLKLRAGVTIKNKTINIEQYLSKERDEDLKILKVCNDYRSKRFGLEPLNEDEEHLKYISNALKAYSYEDVEQAAKHYFETADSEYLNT